MTSKKAEFTIDEIFKDSLNLTLDEEEKQIIEEQKEEIKKMLKVTENGLIIQSEELLQALNKKNLSASLVSSLRQCPADWFLNTFILPKLRHTEPIYFTRGSAFHSAMEEFFKLPKEKRTKKALSAITYEVMKKDYPSLVEDKESMAWMKNALIGYLEGGFNYENVDLAQIEKDGVVKPGIELFVKGKIGDTKRPFVGFVDRLDQLPNGSLQIVDYKTGGKISPFDPSKPINDSNSFDYWRQQLAYTMVLESQGHYIGGAKLEFPVAKGQVIVDVRNEHLRQQVEKDFEAADKLIDKMVQEKFVPFHGHFFCKWCGILSPKFPSPRFGGLDLSWEEINQYLELL